MSALMQAIPEGFKQTEVGIIPEDWNAAPLHEVCSFGGGTTPPRSQHDRYFVGGNNNWIKTTDLNNSLLEISEEQITDLAIAETGLKKHPVGSVLVAMYGGFNQIGRTGYITQPSSINQALVAVKPKPKKLHSYYLLSELNYNVDYWKGVASSSRKDPNITSNDVKNYKIALPSVEEQTAIANALSDVDTLLMELEKLIAKKQAIKTATMQQLLTGKTRLPQFATYTKGTVEGKRKGTKPSELGVIPEDWDVVCINEIATLIGDGIHSTPTYDSNGDYYFVNGNNILRGKLKLTENTNKVSEAEFKKHKKNINERTLFLSINGTIGNLAYYKNEPIILGKSAAFINIKTSTNLEYAYHMLSHEETQQRFEDGLTGSTIKNLGLGTIKSTLIPIPKLEEQTAIATILSDMDNEIQTLEQRLTKTRQIKQGMMQQLLSGRTRLPFKKLETKQDGGS